MNRFEDAAEVLHQSGIMDSLAAYSPTVVSTLWVGLDIEGSDIDILCHYADQSSYVQAVESRCSDFSEYQQQSRDDHVITRFNLADYPVEIYASNQAVTEQAGYIHFQVMKRLVELGGEQFQLAIRDLKRQGLKTEPAITHYLNISGDPYEEVAALQYRQESELIALLELASNNA